MRFTSIQLVISKILTDLGNVPTNSISNIPGWIREVLTRASTNNILELAVLETESENHQVELPCDLYRIEAVSSCGQRLPLGGTSGYIPKAEENTKLVPTANIKPNPDQYTGYHSFDPPPPQVRNHYYTVNMHVLFTSFEKGPVEIHYHRFPIDDEGYPMMPDNDDLKEAILHYVMAKLILRGDIEARHLDYRTAMHEYKQHMIRARYSLNKFTPEHAQRLKRTITRFRMPSDFYETFYKGTHVHEKINQR